MTSMSPTVARFRDIPSAPDRILVVDDDAANVAMLKSLLRTTMPSNIETVTDPAAAVRRLRDYDPDLLILDVLMPGLDSYELLDQIRRCSTPTSFLPVMVITTTDTNEARARAFKLGATDFLTKPFDLTEGVSRIRNLLHLRHLNLRLERRNAQLASQLRQHDEEERREAARGLQINRDLDAVIADELLVMVFQPIIDLADGTLAGCEALARFLKPPLRSPDVWFDEAAVVGRGTELEMRSIERAFRQADDLPPGTFISINASPTTIRSRRLLDLMGSVDASRVVVELTEHEQVDDYAPLLAAIRALRDRGARLAVDDAGSGFAGLQQILRIEPDIIKLDRSIIVGADHDPVRRSLTAALVQFSDAIGATLLAEGIETADELMALRSLGVTLGQGFLLGRPSPLDQQWLTRHAANTASM
jgi:EAL domain-containing protein (putative c-di-GMP-specific phosphodiesterase class I)/CheY-like chemotaxis protein